MRGKFRNNVREKRNNWARTVSVKNVWARRQQKFEKGEKAGILDFEKGVKKTKDQETGPKGKTRPTILKKKRRRSDLAV